MLTWERILEFIAKGNPTPPFRIIKSNEEWREILTTKQFEVTRQKSTERPFTGEYCSSFEAGVYNCVCCGTKLFSSINKYETGSGWPGFSQPVQENVVKYKADNSFGMMRIETICNVCNSHLGHVFPDGPPPTELRYCINSAALIKVSEEK